MLFRSSKIGCPHAVYTIRKTVDLYVQNSSTLNLCFLVMAKGFDKINPSVLLLKLMKRRLPVALIKLLYYWYSISVNLCAGRILFLDHTACLLVFVKGECSARRSFLYISMIC